MSTESSVNLSLSTDNGIVDTTPLNFPKQSNNQLAIKDILGALIKWRVWVMLAYLDIRLRYRRSKLGPFWITLSMAITVYSMGYLYGHLFHTNIAAYFPFLVGGMLAWALISTGITDLVDTFTLSEGVIKQIKLPYTLYIHKIAFRNIIIFFHNLLVIIPVLIIFHQSAKVNLYSLLLFPGLFLIYVNFICVGTLLAMVGSRYRDISQIVKSLVSVIFFVTPVMWQPAALPANKLFLVKLNPFYSFIEIVRAPMIGQLPALSSYLTVIFLTLATATISWHVFKRHRARIIYWI